MNRAHPIRGPLPAAAAVLLLAAACGGDGNAAANAATNLFTVVRGDLPITVKENAELQALRETTVRSGIEGQTTVISIVPEGTMVQQGDVLVELNASELTEKRATQAIAVTKAEAAWQQSGEDHRILGKEVTTRFGTANSNLTIARLQLEKFLGQRNGRPADADGTNAEMIKKLAELVNSPPEDEPTSAPAGDGTAAPTRRTLVTQIDPRKFSRLLDKAKELLRLAPDSAPTDGDVAAPLDATSSGYALDHDMGEMANKVLQQVDQIRLAMADLKVKFDTFSHSQRLAQKQFITRNELERDQLAWQSQVSKVTLAWNDLDLLINYTLAEQIIKLRQDVDNARLELERVVASNKAAELKAISDEDSKKAEYDLAKERLVNLERQIDSAVIKAPTPGVVVYARIDRGRSGEAVREGVQVRERQELIMLPDTTRMRAVIKVQEAQVEKLAVGLPAFVQAEAFPGETFRGRITSVAPVADSNSGWMTSDRKVYTTVVELDGDNPGGRLRSRMAAAVTIQVGTIRDVLAVPSQAVRRDRSVNYVWKETPNGPLATPVEIGEHNSERVAITRGIAEGDVVHLIPPPSEQEPKFEQPVIPADAPQPPASAPPKPPADGPTDAARPDDARGAGGPGGPGRRNGGMGRKRVTDMTAEERTDYLGRLDGMLGMAERGGATPEQTQTFVDTVAKLRAAIETNQIEAAQTHQDALSAQLRTLMGNRGRRGGGEDAGGDGAPRERAPRDGGNR